MKNKELAAIFERIGDVLEFKGENPFKIIAYRRAARVLADLTRDIESFHEKGTLKTIPGIGEGIAKKIDEYLTTGAMRKYEEVVREAPDELLDLLPVPGLGPKTLRLAAQELHVRTLEDLKKVLMDGSFALLPRMGEKKARNILKGLERFEASRKRILLGDAFPLVRAIVESLKETEGISLISPAGSLRRLSETVGDIDILVAADAGEEIIHRFAHLPDVVQVLAEGATKGSVVVRDGYQVDLRVVAEESYGAALQYFTGSKAHNVKLRGMARENGLKISEYGVFRGEKMIAGSTEEEVYGTLDLVWIPPELREDRGEIEAAARKKLPVLVQPEDLKGDLHVHSEYSDGTTSIRTIAEEAIRRGHRYVAICDHSKSVRYAGGMSESKIMRQIDEIAKLNDELTEFTVLSGVEVDILQDGSLDYSDQVLEKLDLVVAAIHSGFKHRCTERMKAAMENPHVDIIAHPTGRLISYREGYEIDIGQVMEKAAETRTALEINSYYERLDLNEVNARRAKECGVKLSIGTDAHHPSQLWMTELGVAVARRGWLESEDVLNTMSVEELKRYLSRS
jgi:DNA polymerase (family 10)